MGNNRTGSGQRIKTLCSINNLNEDDLYNKSKMVLEIYRDVCWKSAECASDLREQVDYECEYMSGTLNSALLYLESFAPDESRDRFTRRIQNLFETKWMIEIVDAAMLRVREFPLKGDMYASLLSMYYLSKYEFSEDELMEEFNWGRSTYYRRKKEAIKVFGLALWGGSIEEFRDTMGISHEPIQMSIDDYDYAGNWLY